MKIEEFKLVENKSRPDFCYAFEKYNSCKTEKYSIFTMNGGVTFLATVTSVNNLGKLVDTDYSQTFTTKELALIGIETFLSNRTNS